MRVDWRGKGHLLLASGGNRQVGGDNIPLTGVKRADELVAGNRNKDDTDLKMTMFELFLLHQALIEASLKLHKNIVRSAALRPFVNKEKGFAEGG